MTGQQLLDDHYYHIFTRIFAPRYDELDKATQYQWDQLAERITNVLTTKIHES